MPGKTTCSNIQQVFSLLRYGGVQAENAHTTSASRVAHAIMLMTCLSELEARLQHSGLGPACLEEACTRHALQPLTCKIAR